MRAITGKNKIQTWKTGYPEKRMLRRWRSRVLSQETTMKCCEVLKKYNTVVVLISRSDPVWRLDNAVNPVANYRMHRPSVIACLEAARKWQVRLHLWGVPAMPTIPGLQQAYSTNAARLKSRQIRVLLDRLNFQQLTISPTV